MTREEALKYAENKYSCNSYRCEMGYLNKGLSTIAERENEFLRVAISALREQGATDNNVGGKPTNADRIRAMSDEELAAHTVQDSLEYTVDYDWDEEPIGEYTPCFKTSDGSIFWSYEEAVEYETQWLKQPAEEEKQ